MNCNTPGLPCPSPAPRVYSNSCPSCWWCHPTISSPVIPFSSCPQSFPALGSFQMSQLFTSGGQSIRVSASASVLPMNIQDWFPLRWTGWISLGGFTTQELAGSPIKASLLPSPCGAALPAEEGSKPNLQSPGLEGVSGGSEDSPCPALCSVQSLNQIPSGELLRVPFSTDWKGVVLSTPLFWVGTP